MKILFTTLLATIIYALLTSNNTAAQAGHWERVYGNVPVSEGRIVAPIPGKGFFVGGSYGGQECGGAAWVSLDGGSDSARNLNIAQGIRLSTISAAVAPDSNSVFFSGKVELSDVASIVENIVYQMGSNGVCKKIFSLKVDSTPGRASGITGITVGNDRNLYGIIGDSSLIKLSTSGKLFWIRKLPAGIRYSGIMNLSGALYISSDQGIARIDTSGHVISQRKFSQGVNRTCTLPAGNMAVASGAYLYVLDSSFKTRDSVAMDNGIVSISALTARSDLILAAVYDGSSTPKVVGYSMDMKSARVITLPVHTVINDMAVSGSRLVMTGYEYSSPNGQQNDIALQRFYIRHIDLDMKSLFSSRNFDAGVVKIIPRRVVYNDPSPHMTRLYADVIVKNYGSETIDSLWLTCPKGIATFPCKLILTHQIYQGLHLTPGDTARLSIAIADYDMPLQDSFAFTYCLYASAPDGLPDLNPDNDYACLEGEIAGIEPAAAAGRYSISCYPDPVTDQLHIAFPALASGSNPTVRITDCSGRIMLTASNIMGSKSECSLDVSSLHRGLYFIQLQTDAGCFAKSFLKE